MKVPKGMVRYESAATKAKGPTATTMAVGEEGAAPGGGGRMTTMAVGEEGTAPGGGGGRMTTMAVGEEGTAPGRPPPTMTTLAVGEEGTAPGRPPPTVTTLALGEEGGGQGQSTFTAKVTTLLSDKKINNEANDYRAYGRTLPGHAAPLFGQQFKFGKAEAVKLSKSITANYEPAAQKKILKEIHMRSSTNEQSKGTVALTRDGAAELNKLSKKLGLDLKFTFNQPKPIHPVG